MFVSRRLQPGRVGYHKWDVACSIACGIACVCLYVYARLVLSSVSSARLSKINVASLQMLDRTHRSGSVWWTKKGMLLNTEGGLGQRQIDRVERGFVLFLGGLLVRDFEFLYVVEKEGSQRREGRRRSCGVWELFVCHEAVVVVRPTQNPRSRLTMPLKLSHQRSRCDTAHRMPGSRVSVLCTRTAAAAVGDAAVPTRL